MRWYEVKKSVHQQPILLMHVQIEMSLRVPSNTELTGLTGASTTFQSEKSGSTRNAHPRAGRQAESKRAYVSPCLKHVVVVPKATQMQCGTHSSSTIEGLAGKPSEIELKTIEAGDNSESA